MTFHEENGQLIPEPRNAESLLALHGSLKGYRLEETLQEERKAEQLREERKYNQQ